VPAQYFLKRAARNVLAKGVLYVFTVPAAVAVGIGTSAAQGS
jgi:hypothetical protein